MSSRRLIMSGLVTMVGILAAGSLSAAPVTVPTIFGSGFCSGTLLPTTGSTDCNYTGSGGWITEPPYPAVALQHPAYVNPDLSGAQSDWITPSPGGGSFGAGPFSADASFSLAGYNPTSLVLTLAIAADNLFTVIIDGSTVFTSAQAGCVADDGSLTNYCYQEWSTLTLTNSQLITDGVAGGFNGGINTIEVDVTNTNVPSPAGFRLELSGKANALGGVPEPGTWMLLSAGLAGVAFLRRRRA